MPQPLNDMRLGGHGYLSPFLASLWDTGFGGKHGFELALNCGGVVVAENLTLDFIEGNFAPIAGEGF